MDISFTSPKIEKIASSAKELTKKFGNQSPHIQKRLTQLYASPTMQEFNYDTPHPLQNNYAGCIAIDLLQPYRIIVRPIGICDISQRDTITDIEIVELCKDYH